MAEVTDEAADKAADFVPWVVYAFGEVACIQIQSPVLVYVTILHISSLGPGFTELGLGDALRARAEASTIRIHSVRDIKKEYNPYILMVW